jgi:hypothetical protein
VYEAGAEAQRQIKQANERLVRAIEAVVPEERQVPFLCECVDPLCTDPVPMTLEEYSAVRSHPRRFTIVPGHGTVTGERVVGEDERFQVTEKPDDRS